ncbi:MAG: 30S ribosomal protein S8 [Nanoarchaeota archaeon]
MSQDVVADALNKIMNAKRAKKKVLEVKMYSRILLSVLAIAKLKGYISDYKIENKTLKIELGALTACGPIKPRFAVQVDEIEEYVSMYLPAKNIGFLIVSTSQGLMTHQTAIEKKIGGSLIAFIY